MDGVQGRVLPVCRVYLDLVSSRATLQEDEGKLADWHADMYNVYINQGHLASVHSGEENTFIANQVKSAARRFWIGGKKERGSFKWTDGSIFQYKNFCPGKPDGGKIKKRFLFIFAVRQGIQGNISRTYTFLLFSFVQQTLMFFIKNVWSNNVPKTALTLDGAPEDFGTISHVITDYDLFVN